MRKKLVFSTTLLLIAYWGQAQFNFSDLKFFVGSGSDTAMLVVDFKDGTSDSSYAWGYLFNGSTDGETILKAVAAADTNFSVDIANGFLNDVIYGQHAGIGGQPDFWSTWSGTDTASLTMNAGIGSSVNPGDWFALSYTDFNPALKPGLPIPAFDPNAFTLADVKTWVGSGSDSAVLVIDFLGNGASYAWGVLFNDSIDGATMLSTVAAADANLLVNASSFLNDLIYQQDSGIGGSPNFWGTWSGTNLGNWYLNAGIGTFVKNGEFFGTSYTDFNPALRPYLPQAVDFLSVETPRLATLLPYPNPASHSINLPSGQAGDAVNFYSLTGEKVARFSLNAEKRISWAQLKPGVYLVEHQGRLHKIVVQ